VFGADPCDNTSHRSVTYGLAAGSEYKTYRPLQYGN
jgi:hypothetical protein